MTFIKNENMYTADQYDLATQTDARNGCRAFCHSTTGTLTSVTDPNGRIVQYTYDTLKRVIGVSATADGDTYRNEYVYQNDRLVQGKTQHRVEYSL